MSSNAKISFRTIWGFSMAVAFAAIGCLVFFTPWLLPYNATNNPDLADENATLRIILGIVFVVYGLMRGYTTWISLRKSN